MFKPVVIVPPIIFCCKEKIQVQNSVAMAHVYTTQGTTIAAVFHGVCFICGVKYFHSYKEKTITSDEEEKKNGTSTHLQMKANIFKFLQKLFLRSPFLPRLQQVSRLVHVLSKVGVKFTMKCTEQRTILGCHH